MRRFITPTLAALLAAAITAGLALAERGNHSDHHFRDFDHSYAIGLWGDLPYSDTQATVGVPNLIADMNSQDLAFTAHDGDLKAGSTECTDAVYTQALSYFNSLRAPGRVHTRRQRLGRLRPHGGLQQSCPAGQGARTVLLDAVHPRPASVSAGGPAHPAVLGRNRPTACVENRRWTLYGITYATLNVQGSCNNLCDTAPDPNEYAARNAADIDWMQGTFDEAKARRSAAVMFISQADPGWDQRGCGERRGKRRG